MDLFLIAARSKECCLIDKVAEICACKAGRTACKHIQICIIRDRFPFCMHIEDAYEACRVIITENREKLDLIASALLERETLNASELEELMTKGTIGDKDKDDNDSDDTGKPLPIPVDVVIDDSTQTSEEAERAEEERPAPIPTTEPKFNLTQWNK